ncbi:hypothetical protein GE21DRAFT_1279983 [Neurospora crassa]|nr:hypothetical protein GE21DRAFT_1279983 [Neurospora crassa]
MMPLRSHERKALTSQLRASAGAGWGVGVLESWGMCPLGQKRKRDGIHSVPFLRTVIAAGDVGDVNPRLLIPGQISTVLSAKENIPHPVTLIHYLRAFTSSEQSRGVMPLEHAVFARFASTLSGTILTRTPLNVVLIAKGPRARTTQVTTAGASRHPIWDSDRSRRSGPRVSFPTNRPIGDVQRENAPKMQKDRELISECS